jgi:hypothetical protein
MLLLHEDLERRRGEGESVSEDWIRQSHAAVSRGVISIMPEFTPRERSRIGRVADRRPEAQTASTAERRRKSSSRFCVIIQDLLLLRRPGGVGRGDQFLERDVVDAVDLAGAARWRPGERGGVRP